MTKKELEDKVIALYQGGLSFRDIERRLDNVINSTTAFNIIKRNNIPTRTRGGIYKIPIEDVVKEYYGNNTPISMIAEKYKVNERTIYNYLENNNYKRKTMGQHHNPNLRHDYFRNIDTEHKAYFLGFIIADGSVGLRNNSSPSIRISINKRDEALLEVFKKEVKSNNKITYSKSKDMVTLSIHSQEMFDDLTRYGIVPNKTFKTYLPTTIDEEFMPHLVRGVFDGDGWVTTRVDSRGHDRIAIGVCGSNNLMEQIRNYFCDELNTYKVKVIQGRTIPFIQFASKKDVTNIARFMYKNSNVYLERKYIILKDVM